MKWWQKKVKGWKVPFWYTDTPLVSKRAVDIGMDKLAKLIRENKDNKMKVAGTFDEVEDKNLPPEITRNPYLNKFTEKLMDLSNRLNEIDDDLGQLIYDSGDSN